VTDVSPRRPKRDLSKVEVRILSQEEARQEENYPEIGGGLVTRYTGFVAKFRDPGLPYTLTIKAGVYKGAAHCTGLYIEADSGAPPITGTLLRDLPIKGYLDRALLNLTPMMPTTWDAILRGWGSEMEPAAFARLQESLNQIHAVDHLSGVELYDLVTADEAADARRRQRPRSELLPIVVNEYRRALSNPQTRRRATQTVADKLGYERGHITRLLTEARKLGLLGPARRGQAGEADLDEPSGSREGTT
jgi:hypothetical protein